MLKLLIKKQLYEDFRTCFYSSKTGQKRSKIATIRLFVLFGFLIVGVLGGTSVALSILFCSPMVEASIPWLYFLIMSGISLLFGVFGSVLSTFASLYLSKDNNLLLSMPIPTKYIVISRLINVLIMSALYTCSGIVPAIIVYFVVAGVTFANVVCNIALMLILTFFVFVLSCLLGFVIAKISLKVRNKSIVSVITTLGILGIYYLSYYKAQVLIKELFSNLAFYGENIKGSAYWLYLFGDIGAGNYLSTLIYFAIVFALTLITYFVLKSTFLKIVISTGKVKKRVEKLKPQKQKGLFKTILLKEFSKFVSSSNYMINCGFSIIITIIFGIVLLVKGEELFNALSSALSRFDEATPLLLCAIFLSLNATFNFAVPSVSLEGKNLWILKSLPINPKTLLNAKLSMQLILSIVPIIFTLICSMFVLKASIIIKVLICVLVLVAVLFSSTFAMFLGIKMPMMMWTNEIVPIKQSGAIAIDMFGGFGIAIVFASVYFLFAYRIGLIIYLSIWSALFLIVAVILYRYIITKGVKLFEKL